MRILILLHNKPHTPYSIYLLSLLLDLLTQKKFPVVTQFSNVPGTENDAERKDEIAMKNVPDSLPSFLYTLYLRTFVKRQKVNWIIQFARGNDFFSLKRPQLVIPFSTRKMILKKPAGSSIKIPVSSGSEKQIAVTKFPVQKENICLVPASANPLFQPIDWSEKQSIKIQCTQGREYFIVNAGRIKEAAFTSLLKAFSSFKKWQHSGMKLVVNGKLSFRQTAEWKEKMNTYKYRDDTVLTENENSLTIYPDLLAAAYAFIHLPSQENDVIPLLEAMQCEMPCISFASDIIEEYAGNAALLIENNNYEALSEAMILLYKDEAKRSRLIEEGKSRAEQYSREKAIQALASVLPTGIP